MKTVDSLVGPFSLAMAQPSSTSSKSFIAGQIVQVAMRPDCSPTELSQLAKSDPAFALRTLAVVNSSAFGLNRPVDDIGRAAALLGVRGLRNLALGMVVTGMAPAGADGMLLLGNCVRRACASVAVARALGERQADEYFTVGLLLEAGLLQWAESDLAGAREVARAPATHRILMERAGSRTPHTVSGAALGREHGLAEATIEAIEHHHDADPPPGKLSRVAWLAERVAAVFEGSDVEGQRQVAMEGALALGMNEAALDAILATLPAAVQDAARVFERDLGEQPSLETLALDANRALVEMNEHYEGLVRKMERLLAEKEALAANLEAANARLALLATTDTLTSLPNKRAFEEATSRELSRGQRLGHPVSLVVIDIDHFKRFNDTYGHATGDRVLQAVGGAISGAVRDSDLPARYGGEEFVALLCDAAPEGARVAAERIRAAVSAVVLEHEGETLRITCSAGFATAYPPMDPTHAAGLFERADAALYEAKRAGRNRVMGESRTRRVA